MIGTVLGAGFGLFAALLLAVLAASTGYHLHTLSVMLLIPVGGALTGLAAGGGMAAGTRLVAAPFSRARLLLAALLGPAAYISVYALLWRLESSDASFWAWLRPYISDSMRALHVGSSGGAASVRLLHDDAAVPAPLAALAWARFILQFIGAAAGSAGLYLLCAGDSEACPACGRDYREPRLLFRAASAEPSQLVSAFRSLKEPAALKAWLEAGRAASPAPTPDEDYMAVRLIACVGDGCGTGRLSVGWRLDTDAGDVARGPETGLELRREQVRLLSSPPAAPPLR